MRNRKEFLERFAKWVGPSAAYCTLKAAREAGLVPVGLRGAPQPLTVEQVAAVLAVYMLKKAKVMRSRAGAARLLVDEREVIDAIHEALLHGRPVTYTGEPPFGYEPGEAEIRTNITLPADMLRDLARLTQFDDQQKEAQA